MKILVDENIPLISVEQLQRSGHDVFDIRGTENQGMTDDVLWLLACQEKRLLITTDRGFAFHRHQDHFGILIISLRQPNSHKIHQRVMEALRVYPPEQWPGLLVIMRDVAISSWKSRD